MQNPIITPRAFFDRVVTPDCMEVFSNPDDVRLVFHACASLHHLKDWVFQAGISGFTSAQDFNTDLNNRCPELQTLREMAINAKHYPPTSAEVMEIGVSIATVPYGSGLYGQGLFGKTQQEQTLAKTATGRTEWALPLIKQGFTFWQAEFQNNNW